MNQSQGLTPTRLMLYTAAVLSVIAMAWLLIQVRGVVALFIVGVLFASAIEKGVLLRGRVLAAVGPHDLDEGWASSLLAAFVASPPPLTT